MRRVVLMIARMAAGFIALLPTMAAAGGWASTHSLTGGSVALTNAQANTVWAPVAVLWAFDCATNATVTVERVSQGHTFPLAAYRLTNGASAVWIPEADYPFALADVLRVVSSATNGVVQVIRKGE